MQIKLQTNSDRLYAILKRYPLLSFSVNGWSFTFTSATPADDVTGLTFM